MRVLPRLAIALVALLGPFAVAGQNRQLAGTVVDAATGSPIAGATVLVAAADGAEVGRVETDEDGRFGITVPAGVTSSVSVAASGYRAPSPVLARANAFGVRRFHFELERIDPDGGARREPTYLVGRVRDADTGRGIEGVLLRLEGRELGALSGSGGRFLLQEVPVGRIELRAEHLAYEAREVALETSGGIALELEILMSTEPIELEGLTVTARSRAAIRKLQPVYERAIRGMGGTFIQREEIERRGGNLAQLLYSIPGLEIRKGLGGWYRIELRRCGAPSLFVDGVNVFRPRDPDTEFYAMPSAEIEIIEVYKGASTLPPEYNDPGTLCAIGVWTRRGG